MKKVLMLAGRILIWLKAHHIKNVVLFFILIGLFLVGLFVAIWVWFTDMEGVEWIVTLMAVSFSGIVFMGSINYRRRFIAKYKKRLRRNKKLRST